MTDQHKKIEERAYHLYLARGGNHGNELEDWLKAEQEILSASNGKKKSTKKTATAAKKKATKKTN